MKTIAGVREQKAKYIDAVIPFDEYFAVQFEKGKRSFNDEYTCKSKATRYSSQSILSGLLVCEECGLSVNHSLLQCGGMTVRQPRRAWEAVLQELINYC